MRSTFIVPTERAPTSNDIKRALLTFDQVKLSDPGDRDLMPPNAAMMALNGGMPFMGGSMGPVRPLAKVASFDRDFEILLDEFADARSQGLVEVVSTYNRKATEAFTLFAVPLGGYPLAPEFVFQMYRCLASNPGFLNATLDTTTGPLRYDPGIQDIPSQKFFADCRINNGPSLPDVSLEGLSDSDVAALTHIARGRIAAVVKYTGYCESKDLVPTYLSAGYSAVLSQILRNISSVLNCPTQDDFWLRRGKVLDLSFCTMLDQSKLDSLSVDDILKFRTNQWGKIEELRESLFDGVFQLATDGAKSNDFDDFVRARLEEIRKVASEIETQRKTLSFKIKCDIGAGALASSLSLATLQAPFHSIATVLAVGGILALKSAKEYGPAFIELKAAEQEAKRGAGFSLAQYFTAIDRSM